MENASKALIMAGSVLIALMIIGALLLMINNLSSYQKTDTINTREAQVIDFNNQYETYNRKNVRGSDLYSLLNRAVDYNKRKSYKGTGATEEGQYLAYKPMVISFDLTTGGGKEKLYATTSGNYPNLIKEDRYTVDETSNKFENQISGTVKNLEKVYGSDSLSNLVIGMSEIFDTTMSSSEEEKQEAIDTFNIASRKKVTTFLELLDCKPDVYTYSEYIQFKRAKFDCKNTDYDPKTGRIIKMEFEFTGKFQ